MVELDQILDGQENSPQSVFNDILTHLAGGCDGHGVGVDHTETLLVDGLLGLGGGHLLLTMVPNAEALEVLIDDKAGLGMMDVSTLGSNGLKVNGGADLTARDLGEFRLNIKGEGTKLADVDTLTLAEIVVKIGDKSSPNNEHLGLRLYWLLVGVGPLGGSVVLSGVLGSILENPVDDLFDAESVGGLAGVDHSLHALQH